ncbi:MAG: bifunctional folylpolyglutamate synthase/dihydrofolate synthase [Nitrosomonadales bacterium]|nr:bifunctional folylpolyglutamate synthase/dihydrofolate synthase [Nitrosomonadales bacterium]
MPETLADWLSYLESLHPKTIALGLERVAEVKARLHLSPDFPVIIVGGTNGKGSVCAMLEAILHAAGYRVGCYTSPHLLHYNERVRVGKRQVSDAELCASFERIERARVVGEANSARESLTPALSRGERGQALPPPLGVGWDAGGCVEIPLTYFEFGTLAAMQCFIERGVDVAILEVGLGGRLDAVNVFDADVAVVTSVDIDHVDYLGDTREQIAFEKAGIFRAGRVAICADGDVPQALRDHAAKIGAELWCIGGEFGFDLPSPLGGRGGEGGVPMERASPTLTLPRREREQIQGQWNFRGKSGVRAALPHPALRGAFQLNNASAVLAALDALQGKLPVGMEAVRRGLVEVELAGRFQFVPGRPTLILDVAHNPHAARSLAQNLASLPPAKTFAVFAMLKDKDMAGVIEALRDQIDVWLVAGIAAPRGATAAELAAVLAAAQVRGSVEIFANAAAALSHACNVATENDRICAFGSFYTVAEVMQARSLRVG